MAPNLVSRLRRPVALLAAALFLFGSAGKSIAGVECHRGMDESHHASFGGVHHDSASDPSGQADHERGGGAAPCECLDFCQHSSYAATQGNAFEPIHVELAGESVILAASSFVTRPPYFLPYPNGPPLG